MTTPSPPPSEREAEEAFRRGKDCLARGDREGAERAFSEAVELDPAHVGALNNWALLRQRAGEPERAHALLRAAVETGRATPRVLANLGRSHLRRGELAEAEGALERACAADPTLAVAWLSRVDVLRTRGEEGRALRVLERAAAACPGAAEVWNALGLARQRAGDDASALEALSEARRLDPDRSEIAANLGDAQRRAGQLEVACATLEAAVALDPTAAAHQLSLSLAAHAAGRAAHAARAGLAAWTAATGVARLEAGSSYLFVASHDPDTSPADLAAAHRRWGDEALAAAPPGAVAPPRRAGPLRVGFLSPDFREHVVARFLEPVLSAFDRARVTPVLLSSGVVVDHVSARLRASAEWVSVVGLDDAEARARILDAELDALVDLAGHAGDSTVRWMAQRLAPVQASWLGYPGGTGLAQVDVRISDGFADPPGTEIDFVERVVRLPRCAWAYPCSPPSTEPRDGPFTFGCFNRVAKWSPALVDAWCEILRLAPDARLVLRAAALADPALRARFALRFEDAGVGDRVELRGPTQDPARAWAEHGDVDVALDSFPYQGTTTTCDALSVGTPVLAWCGAWPAARVARSLLAAADASEWVASSREEYVRLAVAAAGDAARTRGQRERVAGAFRSGALGDAKGLALELQRVFEHLVGDA